MTMGIQRCVIRLAHLLFKRVFDKIIIRRANVRVSEKVARRVDARVVVAAVILVVFDDLDAVFCLEVLKSLLHVPRNEHDLIYSGLLQLPDLALYKHLSAHGEQSLVRFIR